jgi:hypothetical protein
VPIDREPIYRIVRPRLSFQFESRWRRLGRLLDALRGAREDDRPFLRGVEEVCMSEYAIALWGVWRPGPEEEVSLDSHCGW